jgi:hypothetical protein
VPHEGKHQQDSGEHRHPHPWGSEVTLLRRQAGDTEEEQRKAGGSSAMPRKSNDSDGRVCRWKNHERVDRGDEAERGALIRKIQCQLACSMSQPP